jgi:hypothetical protein
MFVLKNLQYISTSHYTDHIISTDTYMLTIPVTDTLKILLWIPHIFYRRHHSVQLRVNL